MLTLDSTQLGALASPSKRVLWLFDVTPSVGATLHWSTQEIVVDGTAYEAAIRPASFNGVAMPRARTEAGMIPLPTCSFIATNAISVPYAPTDFNEATVTIRLLINHVQCRSWKMVVTSCAPGFKSLAFECEGFLRRHLKGDLPKSTKIKRLDPTYKGNDDDCVPVAYGPAYLPLPCLLDGTANSGNRAYMVGSTDLGENYTVSACHTSKDWGSNSEWLAANFTFNYGTMADLSHWLLRPQIGPIGTTPETYGTGFSPNGDNQPICAKYTCSRTATITAPELVIKDVLEQMGVVTLTELDLGTSASVFASRNLTFYGGWTKRQAAEPFFAQLLAECHAEIDCRDKIYLRAISATPVGTLGASDVLRHDSQSSWGYTSRVAQDYDSGHVTYSAADTPDDQRISAIVGVDNDGGGDTADNPGYESFDLHLIHNPQLATKLACLRLQRKLLIVGQPAWESPLSRLAWQPGDVVTVTNTDYGAAGGTYPVLIDEMTIERQGTIKFSGLRLHRMDSFETLTMPTLVIPTDGSEPTMLPPYIEDLYAKDVLTPDQKQVVKKEFAGFTAEKAVLDAKAITLGISSLDYDAAYDALSAIVTPHITEPGLYRIKTTIDNLAFHAAWTAYTSAKALLLNAISVQTGGFEVGPNSLTTEAMGIISGPDALLIFGNPSDYAAAGVGFKNTGAGKLAAGNIAWDELGNLFIAGTVTAGEIHIPNNETANSFHTNEQGDSWWGCTEVEFDAVHDNAVAYILRTGEAKFFFVTAAGDVSVQYTNTPSFTINFNNADIDAELRFGRTTGGTASLVWNGVTVNCTKPLKPVELGINNISATEPVSPFAGQIWVQP